MTEEIDITQPAGPRIPGPAVNRAAPEAIPLFPEWLLGSGAWSDSGYWLDASAWSDAA